MSPLARRAALALSSSAVRGRGRVPPRPPPLPPSSSPLSSSAAIVRSSSYRPLPSSSSSSSSYFSASSSTSSTTGSSPPPPARWSDLPPSRTPVIIDGVRLPFALSSTIYEDLMAVDLQRMAFRALLDKTAIRGEDVEYVVAGNVIQEVTTSNIAREAALGAGLPDRIGAHTVAMACISSNAAICTAAEKVQSGQCRSAIAGGVEFFSDVPIRLTRHMRQKLIKLPKAMKKGGPIGAARHVLKGLRPKHLGVERPAIANHTTGEVMGVSSDRLSARFGVSREDQDAFAVRSHRLAAEAHADGWYEGEVVPYEGSTDENGIKGDSTVESVGRLRPAFVKPHGTHTAANSSFLTDGASASLVMSEERAKELGMTPLAYLRDWSFRACDPFEEMLLGPTYCTHDVLTRNSLTLPEMDVLEIHEAFAGQILSNLVAMSSQSFADSNLDGTRVGDVDVDRLNAKGGSLALGHPFGATGSRLVTAACRRLGEGGGGRFGLVAACADGGTGHACVLERYDG